MNNYSDHSMPSLANTIGVQSMAKTEDQSVDIQGILALLTSSRWIILAFALSGICLAALYLWFAVPVYESGATVQIETKKNSIDAALGNMGDVLGGGGTKPESAAEMEILQSRMVVSNVISGMKLEIWARPHYFPLVGSALVRHRGTLGEPVSALLGMSSYAWGGEKISVSTLEVPADMLGKKLTLTSLGKDDFELRDNHDNSVLTGKVGEEVTADAAEGHYAIFVRELTARQGTRFDLNRQPVLALYAQLKQHLSVTERGKQTGIIGVSYSGSDPQAVTDTVNQLVTAYQKQNVERRSAEAQQTLDFLQQQLPKLREQLDTAEAQLNRYRLKEGSADLTKETELVLQQSVTLESKRLELAQKREEAIRHFTPNHPVLQALDAQIKQIMGEQTGVNGRVKNLPETQQELLRLSRDVKVNTELYTTLLNNAQGLQIARAGTIGNVRIIDYALPPLGASGPIAAKIYTLGLTAGILLGILVSFINRALRNGVQDPMVVETRLGIPTYSTIPYARQQRDISRRIVNGSIPVNERILSATHPHDIATEALRSLRTSLHFAQLEARNNVIMLTGPSPGLGKSFVTSNLGYILAASGKRVAVVDGDLRRGHMHDYFGVERSPGVTDYVASTANYESVIQGTSFDNLVFVPTGKIPPNPAELVLHERFKDLIERLSKDFDYVLIDTPPVLAVTDGVVIGQLAGCTLLVLKAGEHSLHMIEESVRRLHAGGVSVRGTLFNQVGRQPNSYGYKYSYSYNYKPIDS
jgi:tyrosine-protein kinase Etk/Wzc